MYKINFGTTFQFKQNTEVKICFLLYCFEIETDETNTYLVKKIFFHIPFIIFAVKFVIVLICNLNKHRNWYYFYNTFGWLIIVFNK